MPSRFLIELGYNPYGSAGYDSGDGFHDEDGDGFTDMATGMRGGYKEFDDADFVSESGEGYDPFPQDLPVWE